MTSQPLIHEATRKNFADLVLGNSNRGPVLVNYWAPWAGPCLKLWPVLEKLVTEYAGRFLLVNLNTDKEKELAKQFGVNSLPTLKIFHHGKVVEEIHGAESEASLRRVIDKHVITAVDAMIAEHIRLYQQGEVKTAFARLAKLVDERPDDRRAVLTYGKLLLREGRYPEVATILGRLPETEQQTGEVAVLLAHARFLEAAQHAPSTEALEGTIAQTPDNLDARFTLSAVKLLQDDYEGALAQLLEIVRIDRGYREEIGRKGVVAICEILGRDHPLSREYRTRMLDILS